MRWSRPGRRRAGYRLRKFVRRNKGRVIAAGFVLLALVGGMSSATTLGVDRGEGGRRPRAGAPSGTRRTSALAAETKARTQTREALNTMTDDVIETLFAKQPTLGPDETGVPPQGAGLLRNVRRRARATRRRPGSWRRTDNFGWPRCGPFSAKRPKRWPVIAQAIRLWEKLAADFPAVPGYRQELARSHNNLGVLLADLGKRSEAEAEFRQALAIEGETGRRLPRRARVSPGLGRDSQQPGQSVDGPGEGFGGGGGISAGSGDPGKIGGRLSRRARVSP